MRLARLQQQSLPLTEGGHTSSGGVVERYASAFRPYWCVALYPALGRVGDERALLALVHNVGSLHSPDPCGNGGLITYT